ncbi:MAG: hypothetical protein IIA44_06730, partial [Acidobacteria bacterium]|nr:hypothetical protein [Acidobacteriota bacterium]
MTEPIESLRVVGGANLEGEVAVLGAKNAVLKHMVATLLAPGVHHLSNVPRNLDVEIMCDVLRHVGARCDRDGTDLEVTAPEVPLAEAPLDLVRQMRASILILGTLLARTGEARIALPGGDDFGSRPIDLHLSGLEAMGAQFDLSHGVLKASAPDGLHGADIYLEFPSVGATENIVLAAVLACGLGLCSHGRGLWPAIGRPFLRRPELWVPLAGLSLGVLTWLPLPTGVVQLLSPGTRRLLPHWADGALGSLSGAGWTHFSLAPGLSREATFLFLLYVLVFWVTVSVVRSLDDVR